MFAWLTSFWSWLTDGKPVVKRSPRWPAVRAAHLRSEPVCQWCRTTEHLQVHHIAPFHLFPERELDPLNLITLCELPGPNGCHLIRGHLGSWRSCNPSIRSECNAHNSYRGQAQ